MKNSNDDKLIQLLEDMSGMNDISGSKGSETLSWSAYRIAENVNDLSLVDELLDFIENTENITLHEEGYQLLIFIFKNTKNDELLDKLLGSLKKEEHNDESLYRLLIGIWESDKEITNYVEDIIYFITDDRALIRNAAIRILGNCSLDKDLAEEALKEVVKSPYDEHDLKYSIESLGKIGDKETISFLKDFNPEVSTETINKEIINAIIALENK